MLERITRSIQKRIELPANIAIITGAHGYYKTEEEVVKELLKEGSGIDIIINAGDMVGHEGDSSASCIKLLLDYEKIINLAGNHEVLVKKQRKSRRGKPVRTDGDTKYSSELAEKALAVYNELKQGNILKDLLKMPYKVDITDLEGKLLFSVAHALAKKPYFSYKLVGYSKVRVDQFDTKTEVKQPIKTYTEINKSLLKNRIIEMPFVFASEHDGFVVEGHPHYLKRRGIKGGRNKEKVIFDYMEIRETRLTPDQEVGPIKKRLLISVPSLYTDRLPSGAFQGYCILHLDKEGKITIETRKIK